MKAAKRLYRRLKRKVEPILELDVYNKQHQILVALFIVGGVFLFVTLKGLLNMMFAKQSVVVVPPSYVLDAALKDHSQCWFPEADRLNNISSSSISKSQYKRIQLSWKSDLRYIGCRSYGSLHSDTGGSIRHNQRLVYEYDVVKHLNSQWRNNDFASYESRGCAVHASNTGSNLYYNYYVEPVVNSSSNSSHHKHPSDGGVASTLAVTASAASSLYNFFSGQSTNENVHIQITAKNHNRLSDAGMCVMTSYSTATGSTSGSSREFSNSKDLIKCLPSFIIAGVMKSGTGELMKWLNTHPNLISGKGANNKNEIHYFTPDQLPQYPGNLLVNSTSASATSSGGSSSRSTGAVNTTIEHTSNSYKNKKQHQKHHASTPPKTQANFLEYVNHFPSFHANQANLLYTFDKSPDYVRSPEVIFNIVNMLPSIKILLLLRNPTQRTISAFNHNCRHGRYVKLLRDVVVEGVHFRKGRILNTDSKFKSVVSGSSSGHHDSVHYTININGLKEKKDYSLMKYPCKAGDMHEYFTGGLSEVSGIHSHYSSTNSSSSSSSNSHGGSVSAATTRFTDVDHHQAPEATHSFYDDQLNYVLKLVPKNQLKILFQEVLYSNTFKTLREVEGFLGIPCYDYSQVTLLAPTSTSSLRGREGVGEDDALSGFIGNSNNNSSSSSGNSGGGDDVRRPPQRAPMTLEETVEHYSGMVQQFFQLKKKPSSSYQLQKEALPETLDHFRSLFRRHNQKLVTLLQHYQLNEEVTKLKDAIWDL